MERSTRLGLLLGLVGASLAVACSTPPPVAQQERTKPEAVARVKSAASTEKRTNAVTWRIYGGRTQMVVMGFGKDKKPVDGMRVRFATDTNLGWWLSLESLRKGGGMMRLADDQNRVVLDTTTAADKQLMHGAMRALTAYAKKFTGGSSTTSPSSLQVAFADDPCSLPKLAEQAAACASARPVCKKSGTSKALLCSSGALKCAADAAKLAETCAAKGLKSGGGKTEKKKNPAPKIPSIPSLGSSSGGSSSGGSSSGGTKSSSGGTKSSSGGTKSSSGGEGGECKDDPVDCPGSCKDEEEDCPDGNKQGCEGEEDVECSGDSKNDEEEEGEGNEKEDDVEEPSSGDDVDPDPEPSEGTDGPDDAEADDSSFDDSSFESDVGEESRPVFGLFTNARTQPTNRSDASCGASRVLVCGGRSRTGGFCRCVPR